MSTGLKGQSDGNFDSFLYLFRAVYNFGFNQAGKTSCQTLLYCNLSGLRCPSNGYQNTSILSKTGWLIMDLSIDL